VRGAEVNAQLAALEHEMSLYKKLKHKHVVRRGAHVCGT
jgi:hypothetical protein